MPSITAALAKRELQEASPHQPVEPPGEGRGMPRISAALLRREATPVPKAVTIPTTEENTATGEKRPFGDDFLQDIQCRAFKTEPDHFRPPQVRHFNDDVTLESYNPAELSYADKQRKGIHEAFDTCTDMQEHVRKAVSQPFPLASETPLPTETSKAAAFIGRHKTADLTAFWDDQLKALETLVRGNESAQARWDKAIAPSLGPAAGKIRTLALKNLARQLGLGADRWLDQFAVGFPITGTLSQVKAFPHKPPKGDFIQKDTIYKTAEARFRERAPKSGWKNAEALWKEAMEQHSMGWLAAPVPLNDSGRPTDQPSGNYNIVFRFGVEQADKLRACDDLKHGLTNKACQIMTPIRLVSWDHVSQLCRKFANDGQDWALFKADHEAAYKQLPLAPADQNTAIIALRDPKTGKWHGFRSRTLMFGSVAAVLHYNIFSRLVTAVFTRLFGIPLICFFDDFAALLPAQLAGKGLAVFTRFCELLGIRLKRAKSEVGPVITFLGLQGTFPSKSNGSSLSICLPIPKKKAWAALIASYLAQNRLSYQELEKLIGRLSFSQTMLFGKFARTQLRPLYQKQHRRIYNAALSTAERAVLLWWHDIIIAFSPRICRPLSTKFDWLIYTDAASNPPNICALLFDPKTGKAKLDTIKTAFVRPWAHVFKKTCLIFGLELLALTACMEDWAPFLAGRSIWVYMDNNNCLSAVTRGDSNAEAIAVLVSRLWDTLQRHHIAAWFSRVPSKLNPADFPTRDRPLPFKAGRKTTFKSLSSLYRLTVREMRKWTVRPRRGRH